MSTPPASAVENLSSPGVQPSLPIAVPPWSLYRPRQRWGFLVVLFLVSTCRDFDRNVISVLFEGIKQEFGVSDALLGLLGGFCFSIFYVTAGIPVALWADRGNRRTIITGALAVWSAMTVLCGFAQTFWQLALARIGVGAGEAGGGPPAQSLIVDYFPPERRATAIAIFTGGSTAGSLLGVGFGGYIAARYGWRDALLWAGAVGLALPVVVRFTLAEPRLQLGFRTRAQAEKPKEAFTVLWRKTSFRYALAGLIAYFFFLSGALIFVPSFLIRILHIPLMRASATYGVVAAAGSLIGILGGGWLVDRLSARDIRWLAWLPALTFAPMTPILVAAFVTSSFWTFMTLIFIVYLVLSAAVPSLLTAIHAICGSKRRATAIAIVYFTTTLFGGGLGPLITGVLSDAMSVQYGQEGLRYALIGMSPLLLASSAFFFLFGRRMRRDIES